MSLSRKKLTVLKYHIIKHQICLRLFAHAIFLKALSISKDRRGQIFSVSMS